MKPVIPPNHVLRIKREDGRVELELMRFLSIQDMKSRRPRRHQRAWEAPEALR